MAQSKVYCPCGNKCRGGRGRLEVCECIDEPDTMPDPFKQHLAEKAAHMYSGKTTMGKVGNFIFSAGTIYGHVQDDQNPLISFEVYECPACRCQVLYKGTREYGTTRWEKVDVISYCMGDA